MLKYNEFIKENYGKPSGIIMDLINKYGVHIDGSNNVYKDNKKIGKLKKQLVPTGKWGGVTNKTRHITYRDDMESALKDLLD